MPYLFSFGHDASTPRRGLIFLRAFAGFILSVIMLFIDSAGRHCSVRTSAAEKATTDACAEADAFYTPRVTLRQYHQIVVEAMSYAKQCQHHDDFLYSPRDFCRSIQLF